MQAWTSVNQVWEHSLPLALLADQRKVRYNKSKELFIEMLEDMIFHPEILEVNRPIK